jgi:hypothetical protein
VKLCSGGGELVHHSSELACQGSAPTGSWKRPDTITSTTKTTTPASITYEPAVAIRLSSGSAPTSA